MDGDATSRKGRQERVSGWLARYDFATPVRGHLWDEGVALVGRDTVVAVDSGDVSKEFGGRGMEGMEMGHDASRGVEVLFQDARQCFSVEDARVRTFRRLVNLLALCTLAYSYFAHVLPRCGEESAQAPRPGGVPAGLRTLSPGLVRSRLWTAPRGPALSPSVKNPG